ncbi:hypothetical protein FAZ69_14770 [Trinickia terrae]|uniref:Uncharacterized protein n=1 Tax=Trinickia terrae TaxID=2571161 RepID=A0A4U1I533_9BURK|nr:hypothetical protein [Trinickia terrae]TKC88402.1 hypothetical protein FAZ69_14770 [Trinickia terrae]
MFDAYANDDDVLSIEGDALTISNGTARITISGTLDIAKDKRGLKAALALQQAIGSVVAALQAAELPEKVKDEPPEPTGKTDNPFV